MGQYSIEELIANFPQPDHRMVEWPLMDGRIALAISLAYVVIVYVGVAFMKGVEKPLDLKFLRIIHNGVLVLVSLYMSVEIIRQTFIRDTNFKVVCNPVDPTTASNGLAAVLWIFYASKILEFGDTFIMILRKSFAQVSFLHVYHHASIFLIWWLNVKYIPTGDAYLAPLFNSIVHVLMYGYYLIATFGGNPWWKKYLTQFQLLQFIVFILEGVANMALDCETNKTLIVINTVYAVTLFLLFAHFYRKSYTKIQGGKGAADKSKAPRPKKEQ